MLKPHRVDFDDLKARADFRQVLSHYGLSPGGSGDQAKVRCPFHDDERPSCSVNLAKGLFHCFSCQASGNVLEFVHRMEALSAPDGATVSLRQAGLKLAAICGLPVATGTQQRARKSADGPHQPRARDGSPSTTAAAARMRQEPRSEAIAKETAFSTISRPKPRRRRPRAPGNGISERYRAQAQPATRLPPVARSRSPLPARAWYPA
jgi:hypothetical protein